MYIVFSCRKCGHELYMDSYNLRDSNAWRAFDKLSEHDCPACGEEGYENWILVGVKQTFPVDDAISEDE